VDLTYLPVYYPNAEERSNSALYAANVQKAINFFQLIVEFFFGEKKKKVMAAALQVSATNLTIREKLLYHRKILSGGLKWTDQVSSIRAD
jgi:hypothetical protein